MWHNVIPRTIPRRRGIFVGTTAERKRADSGDESGSGRDLQITCVNKGSAYTAVLGEKGPAVLYYLVVDVVLLIKVLSRKYYVKAENR